MLWHFLRKPRLQAIAQPFITSVQTGEYHRITFDQLDHPLYYPARYPLEEVYRVTAETFDARDWHYYQYEPTRVRPGEHLLDVGTAEGLFPLSVADRCARLLLVEPSAEFCAALERTFRPFKDKVTVHQAAVGNQNGTVAFAQNGLLGKVASHGTPVSICRLDDLVPDDFPVSYLKADIEGYELAMLQGAERLIRQYQPRIAITCYHPENDPRAMRDLVLGFVPTYRFHAKGIYQEGGKPVMLHFWPANA